MLKLKGIEVGGVYPTNDGFVEVIEIVDSYHVKIQFLEPKWITFIGAGELRRGQARNRMKPSIQGVGYLGENPEIKNNDKASRLAFDIWRSMIKRCYNPKGRYEGFTYKDNSVVTEWHNFNNFHIWYLNELSKLPKTDFTFQLDKDLLFPGNKIYSPDKCCLIPHAINSLFTDCGRSRGEYPLGVFKQGKRFQAQCRHPTKPRMIGTFSTVAEAQIAYWCQKFDAIHYAALVNWNYIPEILAMRLIQFTWKDAVDYYGEDAYIRLET